MSTRGEERQGVGAQAGSPAPFGNYDDWIGTRIAVPTPGTPVQGPKISIPDGVALLLKARNENTGRVYYQRTSEAVLNTNQRFSLDPGESFSYFVTSADLFWFDAATAGEGVEISVEVGRPRGSGILPEFRI